MVTSPETVIIAATDEKLFRQLEKVIQPTGFRVSHCANLKALRQPNSGNGSPCVLILGNEVGVEFLGRLRESGWEMPVIMTHLRGSLADATHAIQSGAEDYFTNPLRPDALLHSVRRAMIKARQRAQSRQVNGALLARARTLTSRECEIIRLMLAGLLNKQIADELGLALVTIKFHRGSAMRKLGARTAAELARIVRELGLLESDFPLASPPPGVPPAFPRLGPTTKKG